MSINNNNIQAITEGFTKGKYVGYKETNGKFEFKAFDKKAMKANKKKQEGQYTTDYVSVSQKVNDFVSAAGLEENQLTELATKITDRATELQKKTSGFLGVLIHIFGNFSGILQRVTSLFLLAEQMRGRASPASSGMFATQLILPIDLKKEGKGKEHGVHQNKKTGKKGEVSEGDESAHNSDSEIDPQVNGKWMGGSPAPAPFPIHQNVPLPPTPPGMGSSASKQRPVIKGDPIQGHAAEDIQMTSQWKSKSNEEVKQQVEGLEDYVKRFENFSRPVREGAILHRNYAKRLETVMSAHNDAMAKIRDKESVLNALKGAEEKAYSREAVEGVIRSATVGNVEEALIEAGMVAVLRTGKKGTVHVPFYPLHVWEATNAILKDMSPQVRGGIPEKLPESQRTDVQIEKIEAQLSEQNRTVYGPENVSSQEIQKVKEEIANLEKELVELKLIPRSRRTHTQQNRISDSREGLYRKISLLESKLLVLEGSQKRKEELQHQKQEIIEQRFLGQTSFGDLNKLKKTMDKRIIEYQRGIKQRKERLEGKTTRKMRTKKTNNKSHAAQTKKANSLLGGLYNTQNAEAMILGANLKKGNVDDVEYIV